MTAIVDGAPTVFPDPTWDWQTSMRHAIRDVRGLLRAVELPLDRAEELGDAARDFGVLVPWEFVRRMEPGNAKDPLLLQVLPDSREVIPAYGFTQDAVGDLEAHLKGGLLKKYGSRALLVTHGTCAAHCRYCFRRHFPYQQMGLPVWEHALDTLASLSDVDELILSGGDPLTLSDARLAVLIRRVAESPSIRRLRIHTRLPVLIPNRVNESLITVLESFPGQVYVVIHANHPREVDELVAAACQRLLRAAVPVLNQSVLLAGVNDEPGVLEELNRRLVDIGVLPYYLHQLDPVAGAAHFEVPKSIGIERMQSMQDRLPGMAIPKYVQEIPGERSKTPIAPAIAPASKAQEILSRGPREEREYH